MCKFARKNIINYTREPLKEVTQNIHNKDNGRMTNKKRRHVSKARCVYMCLYVCAYAHVTDTDWFTMQHTTSRILHLVHEHE